MKKKFVLNLILAVIMVMGMSFSNAANSKYFKNITENIINMHVVEYGTEVSSVSASAVLTSSDTSIARVEGNSLKIVGTGHFNVTVKDNGAESTYKFFAWNAYLKSGKYYTYSDVNRSDKGNVLYARTYLDLAETTNSKSLKIEEHFFATGSFNGTLDGKYLTSYYDSANNTSTSKYYVYAFDSDIKVETPEETPPTETPPTETPIPEEPDIDESVISVSGVKLDKINATLKVGETLQLVATVAPENATNKETKWASNDTSIVTIDDKGLVTALKAGTATVAVACSQNDYYRAYCTITVQAANVEIPDSTLPSGENSGEEFTGKPIYNYAVSGKVVKSYSDSSINVSVEKISKYYVTKIWVKDPATQVKKKEAGWRKNLTTVNDMLNATQNAIVGCNGSGFYKKGSWTPSEKAIKRTSWNKTTEGYLVISNGVTRRCISGQKTNSLLGILPNGSFKYYEASPYSDVYNNGVRDTFTFGPMLIKDGKKYTQKVGKIRQSYDGSAAYRTAVGQVDENNFIIMTTASKSKLTDMADLGLKLDCQTLFNMDGGGSTSLWFRGGLSGKGTQVKSSSRGVADALYFISAEK